MYHSLSVSPTSAIAALLILLTPHLAAAQSGDGGAATGNLPGGANAGAQGPDKSSANISLGATVAIAVVVGIVVILGALTAFLFFSAKKRQWTMREQLRHSRRRVTTGLKALASPLTPARGTFAFTPVRTRFASKETAGLRESSPKRPAQTGKFNFSRKNRGEGQEEDTYALRGRDLEKGEGTQVNETLKAGSSRGSNGGAGVERSKRQEMKIEIPKPISNAVEPPKTPMWDKFLGRT